MKKKISTIEDLAVLVQKEFLAVENRLGTRIDGLSHEIKELRKEIKELRYDLDELKLKMTNVAWGFELKDMDKRLRRVEAKVGLRS